MSNTNGRAIRFSQLTISDTHISVNAEYSEQLNLWFEFDRRIPVSSTQVACALSTLCVGRFERIDFEFEVEGSAVEVIEKFVGADVQAFRISDSPVPMRHDINVLSFSGGFDSLSAWRIMPEDTQLVSLDFGGWFEREAEFFKDFDTLTIRTNVRSAPSQADSLARNHWSFMAIGAILTSTYFNAANHSFGSILGESLSELSGGAQTLPLLNLLGMKEIGYARGLTEVGTASIILQSDPGLVARSLKSLAGPRDRKIFRKTALCSTVSRKLGIDIQAPELNLTKSPQIPFGDDYASSLAALYCLSRGEFEPISSLFSEVPESARRIAEELNMTFMERVNWDQYQDIPDALRGDLWSKFDRFGLEPYSRVDWQEVEVVREYMKDVHEVL